MKNYNHSFTTYKLLDQFLDAHKIQETKTVLIQCFDGILDVAATRKLLVYLKKQLPHSKIVGASTDGEIIDGASTDGTFILSFSLFDSSHITSQVLPLNNDSFKTGVSFGKTSLSFNSQAMIVFSDPFTTNGDALLQGIDSIHPNIIIAGGMAADNSDFKHCYVIYETDIYEKSAVALFLKGDTLRVHNMNSFD
jgi:hypothetical protein